MTYTPAVAAAAAKAQQQRNPGTTKVQQAAQEPQHVAATTVERTGKTVLNDTKAIIESSTGVKRSPVSRLPYEDKDAVGKNPVEFYPVYAPIGGVTMRVERYHGNPAVWMDMTLDEAYAAASELVDVIAEIEKSTLPVPKDLKEAKATVGAEKTTDAKVYDYSKHRTGREYVPLVWIVDEWDADRDPADKEGMTPVINNKNDAIVWFGEEENALEIVGRLNDPYRTLNSC